MKKRKNVLINKKITFRCDNCCSKEEVWLETGLEDNDFYNEKIVPQVIKCPVCGEHLMYRSDYRNDRILSAPIFLTKKMKWFENPKYDSTAILHG